MMKSNYLYSNSGLFLSLVLGVTLCGGPDPEPSENVLPQVYIVSPEAGESFVSGTNITITAEAYDTDGDIEKVEFYAGATYLGDDTSSPFSHTENNVPAGEFSLTAKAYDDDGGIAVSSAITIFISTTASSNQPPTVAITDPSNGATFYEGDDVTVTVSSSDSDGNVVKVKFYADENELAEDYTSPYSITYPNTPAGEYDLKAVSYDNDGDSTVSEVVAIVVQSGAGTGNVVECSSVNEIKDAMENAQPGDIIRILSGTYTSSSGSSGYSNAHYFSSVSGTSTNPITLESSNPNSMSILSGSSNGSKYVLYITGSHWIIKDLKFKTGKKGIMLDGSNYSKILGCEVYDIGEEGIHLRDGSSYVEVSNNFIHDTGKTTERYGEGIYIGSDNGKWGDFVKECDNNLIAHNTIGPDVTAEHIDLKEGSSNNIIEYNTFDGDGISDLLNGGTSFMDVKGNNNIVRLNCGFQNANTLLENAFEVHVKVSGWGEGNSFINNHIDFSSGNNDSYVVAVSNGVTSTTAGCNARVPSGNMYAGTVGTVSCDSNDTPSNCSL